MSRRGVEYKGGNHTLRFLFMFFFFTTLIVESILPSNLTVIWLLQQSVKVKKIHTLYVLNNNISFLRSVNQLCEV